MRITGGAFGGRRLTQPADPRVRPTSDRVREAWMNILGPDLEGARVLDLFAGSGALGLDALSRGAASVTFVELSPASLAAIRANIEALGVADRVEVRRGDALRVVARLSGQPYDVVVADPPWFMDHASALLERFRADPFARILSVEHPASREVPGDETRRYGDTAITFAYAP